MATGKANTQVKKKGGRKAGEFNEAKQLLFIEHYVARRGNVMGACTDAGISRTQYYAWRSKDPNFKKLMKRAMKQLEETLFEAACNHGVDGDATLIIFALKALNRARFDDRFIAQKYAMAKGLNPDGSQPMRVIPVLVREPEPWMLNNSNDEANEPKAH